MGKQENFEELSKAEPITLNDEEIEPIYCNFCCKHIGWCNITSRTSDMLCIECGTE